ncbi:D-alanyl-D-alanine carboxypeptidase/D-alanyl-D-alanine-endopeptidase [Bdellovibrio sp. qaytius]|nr:D-alanyl-D-alanine carboxypeptidase/D-alanyl-D-alanine-endopeptidase [Bdellovibrio sp. qaytius]
MNYILRLSVLLNYSLAPLRATCLAILLTTSSVMAQGLQADIKEILAKHKINPDHVGMVISLKDQNVYENNLKKQFIPASISKLLTSYSVLKNIELTQKFKTELYFDGKNLYLKGGGDPSFVSENLWYLVNEFTRQKIGVIPGDIVVDDYYFDDVRFDSSRESERVDRSYDAPVGAMSFNWNSVNVFVKPGPTENKEAHVVLDPQNTYFTLVNRTTTKANKLSRELIIDVNQKNRTITVTGDVLKGGIEKAYFKNVAEPELWAGDNLKAFLLQRNIEVKGKIKHGKTPSDANKLVTFESKSLSLILADMNKFSNNYVAEMFTKNLAALSGETPATLSTGVKVIQKNLKELGLTKDDFTVLNPSGFTRDNRASAYTMGVVLKAMQNDFRYFPTLLESLPISAIDGTLKKRMKNTSAAGFVRAKTGYLDGVVSLAGYAGQKDGDIYRFAFLYNGPQDEARVREAFDQVLVSLLK